MKLSTLSLLLLELCEGYFGNYRRSLAWMMSAGQNTPNLNRKYKRTHRKLTRDNLTKTDQDFISLTQQGKQKILKLFPLLKWKQQPWDGFWRVVMYDFPETQRAKRNTLRRLLKKLGFAQWQISVWVSPHPLIKKLNQTLNKYELSQFCSIHKSKRVVGISDKEFASKIWSLKQLNQEYQSIFNHFNPTLKTEYLEKLMKDPMLPISLTPSNYFWEKLLNKVTQTPTLLNDRPSKMVVNQINKNNHS